MLPRYVVSGLIALWLAAPVAAQETSSAQYTISVSGLTAGKMTLAANHDGASYALTSNTASAGLAGLFRSFSVITRAQGAERDGRLIPARYSAQADGAREGRGAELAFKGGVATVVKADAPAPEAPVVDPAQHNGAIDPLTGLYAILRDADPARACQLDFKMFDGHRISRVTLSSPAAVGDGLMCQGVYRRIDGYPAEELAKRGSFPFAVTYRPAENGKLRVTEVSMDSLFGPARMTRDN
ncbi:DUF3108 domain-containing protein [Pseudotabrizicola sp.]|uniref:DUF3108 domain-containing protein n=1 Tax=Pseudotabrizicola sp. TaxID=2939647 RepID=UPI00272615F9|nr:DUF3108 domain-containing protein [Pseudotabrizicola sp.]MDO8882963.1 DUF3108 domain-containing protein [Pseudotabrizicola sp.]